MCTKDQLNEITQRIVDESKNIFNSSLNSVFLFGSYARGDFDEDSDIDILILLDVSSDELSNYSANIDSLCGELLLEYGVVISAILKDVETFYQYADILPFYKNIKEYGIEIA